MGGDKGENHDLRKGQVLWLRGIARLQTQVKMSLPPLHTTTPNNILLQLKLLLLFKIISTTNFKKSQSLLLIHKVFLL
jgi:hypothetical protein